MNKAVFLDRDGIINVDYGYVSTIDRLDFCNGIFNLAKLLISHDFQIFIVTNQSGLSRGYFDNNHFTTLMDYIFGKFKQQKCPIRDYRFCPHLPSDFCNCRKPKPNMIFDLAEKYQIDLSQSMLIGDKMSDIYCGVNAGVGKNFLVSKNTGQFALPENTASFCNLKVLTDSLA